MLNASDEDYKTAVAANLIQHRSDISDISSTLNDTAAVTGNSGVLETQGTQGSDISVLQTKGFTPGACSNGTFHWVFVVGTDNACAYRVYNAGWSVTWYTCGGAFSSGLSAYWVSPRVYVYGRGTGAGNTYYRWATTADNGVLTWGIGWTNLGGNIGSIGQ
jgi:hypothetical protein